MPEFDTDRLREWALGRWVQGRPKRVSGFSIDTRKLKNDDLFVALKTDSRDGHDFLESARLRGASGAIVTRVNNQIRLPQLKVDDPLRALQRIASTWRRGFSHPVIGVTGSCGKTSTKELLAKLLGDTDVHRTRDNSNNQIGVPLTLLEIDPLHHRFAVVEAGSNSPGEIEFLARLIDSNESLITGVAPAHIGNFGTIEKIAAEKAQLGNYTRPDGNVIFPGSCARFSDFDEFLATSIILVPNALSESIPQPNDKLVYWTQFRHTPTKGVCRIELRQPPLSQRRFDITCFSPGMLANAALAIVAATVLGRSDAEIREGLRRWKPAPFRGEGVVRGEQLYYVDCYNANPSSMVDAFDAFDLFAPPEMARLYILGGMAELGELSSQFHREVGEQLVLKGEDRVVLIGDESEQYKEGLLASGAQESQIMLKDSVEGARGILTFFRGAVFIKGSRSFQLERLVPESISDMDDRGEEAC